MIGYILGLYWDAGKENGSYYMIIGYIVGLCDFLKLRRLEIGRSQICW